MTANIIEAHELTTHDEKLTFKNAELTKITARIQTIYLSAVKYAEEKNREIAKLLSCVKQGKLYEQDGFKSVADYANKTFGIKEKAAYALASAGDIYNDDNANPVLKALSPYNAAELASVDKDKVNKAIEDGVIKADSTQKAIKEFKAKANAEAEGPQEGKVVTMYTCRPVDFNPLQGDEPGHVRIYSTPHTIEEWDEYWTNTTRGGSFNQNDRDVEIIKLPKCAPYKSPKDSKKPVIRKLYINSGCAIAVEYYELKAVSKKEVKDILKGMTPDQLEELKRNLQSKTLFADVGHGEDD